MNYNVDFFIEKFEAIPEEIFIENKFSDGYGHCANGWCGVTHFENKPTSQSYALWKIFKELEFGSISDEPYYQYSQIAATINNGNDSRYQQPTPKQRILAALYDIKSNQAVIEVKEIIAEKRTVIERLTENV